MTFRLQVLTKCSTFVYVYGVDEPYVDINLGLVWLDRVESVKAGEDGRTRKYVLLADTLVYIVNWICLMSDHDTKICVL